MRIISLLAVVLLTGCASSMHQPTNDEELCDQDLRFKGALYDTSPRATNRIPKAIPNFRKTYTPCEESPVETVPIEDQGL